MVFTSADIPMFDFPVVTDIVTFELNILLGLSWEAVTKSFSMLSFKLSLEVLGESTRTGAVWIIRVGKGVGDIPCNGLAPFVRLGPLKSLKSTKYQRQTQRRQC